jgi:hypothetical protein
MKKKGTKKLNKLLGKLDKLDKKLHDENPHVTKGEFIESKLSGNVKIYYDSLSPTRKEQFIQFLVKEEEWAAQEHLRTPDEPEIPNETNRPLNSKPAKTLAGLRRDIQKTKKKNKKLAKERKKKGKLASMMEYKSYDQVHLSKKDHRKLISQMADKDRSRLSGTQYDENLEDFKEALRNIKEGRQDITESFWTKHGL